MPEIKPVNRLLARLPQTEYDRLSEHLHPVRLMRRQILYSSRSRFDHVYFPVTGFVSAMTVMEDGGAIEVATIGSEGMTGLTAMIGGETSPYELMVQAQGDALRMPVQKFVEASSEDGPFRQLLANYNTAFACQVSYAVACNGLHKIQQRCCRWLLMTHDRVRSDSLPLTHEFLAIMLGVRRASITEVLRPLQKLGVIRNGRGNIDITDRPGLELLSCECYQAVNDEFSRLLG